MKYKFLNLIKNEIVSKNHEEGKPPFIWKIGTWYKHNNELIMCNSGFHCSNTILDALSYVQGEILAEVKTKGDYDSQSDKEVWQEMKIIKAYKWTKKDSVALSIFSAELVIENFEKLYPDDKRPRLAIEAAKKVLENDSEENRSAAESAAWSVESAARSAARSAESAARSARSAARSAESAAWSVESAARSAARSAESAARSAAWSAAWSAESAARSARSAARSARSAARSVEEINKKINKWLIGHLKDMEVFK